MFRTICYLYNYFSQPHVRSAIQNKLDRNDDNRNENFNDTSIAAKSAVYKKRTAPNFPYTPPPVHRGNSFGKKKPAPQPHEIVKGYDPKFNAIKTEINLPKLNPVKEMEIIMKAKGVEVRLRSSH